MSSYSINLLFMGPIVIICWDLVVVVCNQDFNFKKKLELFENWVISYSFDEMPNKDRD